MVRTDHFKIKRDLVGLVKVFLCINFILLLFGCTPTRPISEASGTQQYNEGRKSTITHSLFDSDERTISEEGIQQILDGEIVLPENIRVAIYKFGNSSVNRYYSNYWNNEEFLKTQQDHIDTLIAQLNNSDRVEKVIMMPSLVMSSRPGITQLRESAVRLQADVLIVFSINSDIYYKYKTFQKNEAKAFATCEAILMDTRTGVIPHSSVVTKEFFVQKGEEDWSNDETRKRAENGAVTLSLVETGNRVAAFLNK